MAVATALAWVGAGVAACATGGGLSTAQRAYNTCTDNYNEQRSNLADYWAFAAGVGSSDATCFWRWGAESATAAVELAMADCREDYEDCYFYSSSAGNSDWVQRISDNGGTDGSGDGGGGLSFSDFVEWGTFALTLGTIGVQTYDTIENGGGSGGDTYAPAPSPDYGATTVPLPQGVAGGSGTIGGQTFGSGGSAPQCGRRYLGLMRQSVCRMGGNIPDSSITSDEVPDPEAGCWTPPC
ncbi:MAG TPA: hypothetical protein VFZ03_09725 [Dongiaceae bacterium]